MRLKDGLDARHGGPRKGGSAWRWFPWALAGGMAVVFAVNGAMVAFAIGTFPGKAGSDGFDLSNHYDRVLETAERQAALGWKLDATLDAAGRPVVTLTDRAGVPLADARVEIVAQRPLGEADRARLTLRAAGAGRYVAEGALPEPGRWDLTLSATAEGHTVAATRRVVVR